MAKQRDYGERDSPEVHRVNQERLGGRDGLPQIESWPPQRVQLTERVTKDQAEGKAARLDADPKKK